MLYIGAGLAVVIIAAVGFIISFLIELMISMVLCVLAVCAGLAGIIALIATELFDGVNFWVVFAIALVVLIVLAVIYLTSMPDSEKPTALKQSNVKKPVEKSIEKPAAKSIIENPLEGVMELDILDTAKKAARTAKDKVAESVPDNVSGRLQDTVRDAGSAVTGSLKGTLKTGVSTVSKISNVSKLFKSAELDRMNAIRFNSSHLTDEQLLDYVKNDTIELYEKLGYASAFADRYPPIDK